MSTVHAFGFVLTDAVRAAMAYQYGALEDDAAVVARVTAQFSALLASYEKLGAWIASVETWPQRTGMFASLRRGAVSGWAVEPAVKDEEFHSNKYFGSVPRGRRRVWTPEQRAKLSAAHKARWAAYSPERRKEIARKAAAGHTIKTEGFATETSFSQDRGNVLAYRKTG